MISERQDGNLGESVSIFDTFKQQSRYSLSNIFAKF